MNITNVKIAAKDNITLAFKSKNKRVKEEYMKELNFDINVPLDIKNPVEKALRMALGLGVRVYIGKVIENQPDFSENNFKKLVMEKLSRCNKNENPITLAIIPNLDILITKGSK